MNKLKLTILSTTMIIVSLLLTSCNVISFLNKDTAVFAYKSIQNDAESIDAYKEVINEADSYSFKYVVKADNEKEDNNENNVDNLFKEDVEVYLKKDGDIFYADIIFAEIYLVDKGDEIVTYTKSKFNLVDGIDETDKWIKDTEEKTDNNFDEEFVEIFDEIFNADKYEYSEDKKGFILKNDKAVNYNSSSINDLVLTFDKLECTIVSEKPKTTFKVYDINNTKLKLPKIEE